jgi:hypothetical protein
MMRMRKALGGLLCSLRTRLEGAALHLTLQLV